MKKVLYRLLLMICILLGSSFLCDNVKATNYCSSKNMMYCEYTITTTGGTLKIAYTIDSSENFRSIVTNSNPAVWAVNQDFNIGQFKFGDNYKCGDEIYWTTTVIGRQIRYDLTKTNQGNGTSAKLTDSCNTFTEDFVQTNYNCGIYGKMNIYSIKNGNSFDYNGTYTGSINGNAVTFSVPGNGFSIKGNVNSNGCPNEVCYTCNAGVKQCYQSNTCYNKTGEILDGEDIKNEQQEGHEGNNGDGVAATLSNAFKVTNGKITCEGALGSAIKLLSKIFGYIKIAAILLFFLFSILDFTKAVTNDGEMNKAFSKMLKRAVIVVLIVILPTIINLILAIIQLNNGLCGI